MTKGFETVGNWKKNEVTSNDGMSAEKFRISLPLKVFIQTDFFILSSSRSWSQKCLTFAKVYPLHMSGDKMNIYNNRSMMMLPDISQVLEENKDERVFLFYKIRNLCYSEEFGFLIYEVLLNNRFKRWVAIIWQHDTPTSYN